jgi:hypothetical protein
MRKDKTLLRCCCGGEEGIRDLQSGQSKPLIEIFEVSRSSRKDFRIASSFSINSP